MAVKKQQKTETQPQHSIPAVIRAASPSVLDEFDSLDAGPSAAKPAAKKSARPEVEIPKEVQEAFKRYIPAKILEDVIGQVVANEKTVVHGNVTGFFNAHPFNCICFKYQVSGVCSS